ncbi:MAG: DNA internalization-related competence protein ComEC/Rec2 [Steroidobacteraceae bacterium]
MTALAHCAVFFVCGELLQLQLASAVAVPRWISVATILALALAHLAALRMGGRNFLHWLVLPLLAAAAGFIHMQGEVARYLAGRWPRADDGQRILAEVIVESIPSRDERGVGFLGIAAAKGKTWRTRITWSEPWRDPPRLGEQWQFVLAMQAPTGFANPGDVARAKARLREGIHAIARVVPSALNRRLTTAGSPIARVRQQVAEHVAATIADRDAAALLAALAVGATQDMSSEQWQVFAATSTTHLVAISGMHVTIFAVVMFALARRLWRALGLARAGLQRDNFAMILALGSATCYAMLAGASIPTLRTLLMLGLFYLARLTGRAAQPASVLAAAAVLLLVCDPTAVLAAGFWLSFVAVGLILFVAEKGLSERGDWRQSLTLQWWIGIGLLPLCSYFFATVPVIGLAVNLLAIPVFGFLLVPLVLVATVALAVTPVCSTWLFTMAWRVHDIFWPVLDWAALHGRIAGASGLDGIALLVIATLAPLMILAVPWRLRAAACLAVLLLLGSRSESPAAGEAIVTFLDVGDSVSIIVRTRRHALVYGTGERYRSAGRVSETVVLPQLHRANLGRVDRLVVPRLSPDRAAGAGEMQGQLEIREVLTERNWQMANRAALRCPETGEWQWDGIWFRFLHGSDSCVLLLGSGSDCLLLASAVRVEHEPVIARQIGCNVMLLLVPRSGAADTAGGGFERGLHPRYAILSASASGRRVRSVASSAARWRAAGAKVLTTGESGAITMRLGSTGLTEPQGERERRRGFWRGW